MRLPDDGIKWAGATPVSGSKIKAGFNEDYLMIILYNSSLTEYYSMVKWALY